MKTILLVLLLYCSCLSAQKNGELISREVVSFPYYNESPSIEMYYDKNTYEAAIEDTTAMIEKLTYYSDGLKVVAYFCAPAKLLNKKYPTIVFNRGSTVRNDISFVHAPLFKKLVKEGFVVIAPALRESEGGEGKDQVGGDDLHDIFNILPLLNTLEIADTENLFMLGESRGGIMTYLAAKNEFPMKAAVVIGGITDMSLFIKDFPYAEKLFEGIYEDYQSDKEKILQSRSAIYWAEKINVPILIINGQADPQVKPYHALNLAMKLTELNKDYQLMIFEGGNHILSKEHIDERDDAVLIWFRKHMQ